MPSTRSSTRKSLGEPTTPKQRMKKHTKELGPGKVPMRISSRPELKNRRLVPVACIRRGPSVKEIGESALSDYNKQHGTDLEYVRPLDGKQKSFMGPGYTIDFTHLHVIWRHFNFEARRRNADPSDKPLLLFAEVYMGEEKYVLTTLLPVEPTDEAHRCKKCPSNISHPHHGFRAGFYNKGKESKILSEQVAAELSEFALHDYNEKQGTNLKFERALACNSFKSAGHLMDFSKTNKTSWVHMNFEARVGRHDKVLGMFAELYLGDGDKYVLSTLSVAEPTNIFGNGEWRKEMKIDHGLCRCCPCEIYHTWLGFRYGYNFPPRKNAPDHNVTQ